MLSGFPSRVSLIGIDFDETLCPTVSMTWYAAVGVNSSNCRLLRIVLCTAACSLPTRWAYGGSSFAATGPDVRYLRLLGLRCR